LANVLFTVELDRRWAGLDVAVKVLHPGVVGTSFGTGPEGPRWMRILMRIGAPLLRSPAKGAATSVLLATAPDEQLERGLYWSNERPKAASPAGVDLDAAARLWTESERLVGL
jgi:hypothetical protein